MAAQEVFCTVINCMDGRTQHPALDFLEKHYGATYVDTITEPGPVAILSERRCQTQLQSILDRIAISVEKHRSRAIAVVAHHDCAGDPLPKEQQLPQLRESVRFLRQQYPQIPVIGLWIGEDWRVELQDDPA